MHSIISKKLDSFLRYPVTKRILHGSIWNLLGTSFYRICMLAGTVIVARQLSIEDFGEFGIIRSTLMTFLVFAGLGLGTTASRFLSQYKIEDKIKAGEIYALSQSSAFVIGILISGVLYSFAHELAKNVLHNGDMAELLKITAIALFFSSLVLAQNGAIAGFEGFKSQSKVYYLLGPLSVLSLFFLTQSFGVLGAVSALAVNTFLHFIFNKILLIVLLRRNDVKAQYSTCTNEFRLLYRYSLPLALGGMLVTPVLWTVNTMLVSQENGYTEFAYLEAANQIRMLILFVPSIGAQVLLPVLSSMNADLNYDSQRYFLFISAIVAGAIACSMCIPVAIFPEQILNLYGGEFSKNGSTTLILLAFSSVFTSINLIIGQALASRDFVWFGLCFNSLWAVSILVLTHLFLSMGMGASGLALANLLSYVLHTLWSVIFCYLKFR